MLGALKRTRFPIWAIFCLLAAAAEVNAEALDKDPRPSPDLGPDEVVRIQLEALRSNDAADRGIAVAYRFASPRNKASTGPLPRFIRMIKVGPYALMLDYDRASYAPVEIAGERAAQRVTLIGGNRIRTYVFLLERQAGPPCEGCWMTAAVMVVPGSDRAA